MAAAPIFHLIPDAPKPVAPYSHVVEVEGWPKSRAGCS
jgi:hypothetical protein